MKCVDTQRQNQSMGDDSLIYVGIDVASRKHDCCILNRDGSALFENFTFTNDRNGFETLISNIVSLKSASGSLNVKIGLESTGHFSTNLTNFLIGQGFEVTTFNPLHVNLYRKAQTLRKTKTDKSDARFLAAMLFSDDTKPYSPASYHISELKALTRHRFRLLSIRSKLKTSYNRQLTILFPASYGRLVHPSEFLSCPPQPVPLRSGHRPMSFDSPYEPPCRSLTRKVWQREGDPDS